MNAVIEHTPNQAVTALQMPILKVEVTGKVLASNLDVYRTAASELIAGINTNLVTDDDFAVADANVKWCAETEEKLELAKKRMLGEMADVNALLTTMDEINEKIRQKRLVLSKLSATRKEQRRQEIVQAGEASLKAHIETQNNSLQYEFVLPSIKADFAGVIKGKRTLAGIKEAVDAEVTRATSEATAVAERMRTNIKAFDDLSEDASYGHLFRDMATLLTKEPEDFAAVVKQRIADELARQARVKAAAEEAERKRIADEQREAERQASVSAIAVPSDDHQKPEQSTDAAPAELVTSTPQAVTSEAPSLTSPVRGRVRPSDIEIVSVLADRYGVSNSRVVAWLHSMNLENPELTASI